MEFNPKRLRAARQELGMTQEQLAAATGLSLRSINRWEAGAGPPSLGHLVRLSTVLGKPIPYFLEALA